MRIAVLGGGVMGETFAGGFLDAVVPRPEIVIVEKRSERAAELRDLLAVDVSSEVSAAADADVVVLAVKPQDVAAVLTDLGTVLRPGTLLVSIAAGIPTSILQAGLPAGVDVVRAMPNTPARIKQAVTGVSPGSACTPEALDLAIVLLESIGTVVSVPEALQDAVTAVSGSGPAYVFLLAEAMTAAAVDLGLDSHTARQMVHGTIKGAAALLDAPGADPQALRLMVTSPHGTTAAAVTTMEAHGFRDAIAAGMAAGRDRSRELAGG